MGCSLVGWWRGRSCCAPLRWTVPFSAAAIPVHQKGGFPQRQGCVPTPAVQTVVRCAPPQLILRSCSSYNCAVVCSREGLFLGRGEQAGTCLKPSKLVLPVRGTPSEGGTCGSVLWGFFCGVLLVHIHSLPTGCRR